MFESRIDSRDATTSRISAELAALFATVARTQNFAGAETIIIAPQYGNSADATHPLAQLYAHANSMTRRRFEAILREAQTTGALGLKLLAARSGRPEAGTVSAARFLGNALSRQLARLENLFAA